MLGRFESEEAAIAHCSTHANAGMLHCAIGFGLMLAIARYAPESLNWLSFVAALYGVMSLTTMMKYKRFSKLQTKMLSGAALTNEESRSLKDLQRIVG